MLGEICCNPESRSVRGELANSGAEQTVDSPRDTITETLDPIKVLKCGRKMSVHLTAEAQSRVKPMEIGGKIPTDSEKRWLRPSLSYDFPH